jgi:uncharacterized protein YggU (UPF0235/DUF167 family)
MIILVKVKPGSKEEKIDKISDNSYVVFVKERAIKGAANLKLIKLLAKEFKVSQKSIIIKNPNSRKKIIEIVQ